MTVVDFSCASARDLPESNMRALAASERAVPEGDGIAFHYSAMIVGLPADQAAVRDRAQPGVVSWETGRRLWAAGVRSLHAEVRYDGPPYVHLKKVIPAGLLAAVDHYQWTPDGGEQFADWDRLPGEEILDLSRRLTDGHPWGFATTEPFFEFYLLARTAPQDGLHNHADGNLDPARRWLGLVGYFTDPGDYEGADLIVTATGERLQPERGDVLLFRGDIEHSLTPLTAGRRVVLTAFKGEPRPALLPRGDRKSDQVV